MKNCFLIVNHNDYKNTKHLIDNIIDYSIIDDIIVVDNNSNKDEKDMLNKITSPKLEIIYNDDNLGYSHAINVGTMKYLEKNDSCNFIISNSDISIFGEEDVKTLVDLLNYDTIGVVGPQIIEKGSKHRGVKSISPNLEILFNLGLCSNRFRDKKLNYPESYYDGDSSVVDTVSSAFFLISSDTLKKINFMDENIFLYYEDFVLGKKVKNLDLMVVISNKVCVKHLYSGSVDKVYKSKEKNNMLRTSQFYYHNTYNVMNALQKFMLRFSELFLINK